MPLRQIVIASAPEFGLTKAVKIRSIHVYLEEDKQQIQVSYFLIWAYDGTEVKREIQHYTLVDTEAKAYLTEWDQAVGDIITAGIEAWFASQTLPEEPIIIA